MHDGMDEIWDNPCTILELARRKTPKVKRERWMNDDTKNSMKSSQKFAFLSLCVNA